VWLLNRQFPPVIDAALARPTFGSGAKSFVRRLKHCRTACKNWSRRQLPVDQRHQDLKILINALDLLEEVRPLHASEAALRLHAVHGLQTIHSEKLEFWRQRFNLRVALEWDENSRFFHAAASGRRRKNSIACLEVDGLATTAHAAKSTILYNFYSELLGRPCSVEWRFSLRDLYPHVDVSSPALTAAFSHSEITEALFSMDTRASPGPDGFGPSFYRKFWPSLCLNIQQLFTDFFDGTLDLDGLNRALLVLIPKKDGVRTPDGFRPISLQNCPMKLFSKVMVNRVKPLIPTIVDADQTGFIHGRSIAENFVYAADLLSVCYKRNVPTAVLKLDFRKAFDSVEWSSLDAILHARGFDDRWRRWVSSILSSGKTAILLNGVPGRWITCRRGLRQGDPLSPYLFIIVADVLQKLIRRASVSGDLSHPVDASLPCPVLQYADDTLILTRGDVASMQVLRGILDDFSLATGLTINYHKSTFVPMNVDAPTASEMANILGCTCSAFPQTYLGLPLSPYKLRPSDFQPLISSFDKYLSGWKARLLSSGGRLTLVNAVLGSLPIYYMSSILLPKSVRDLIDSKRRAFLWTGEDKCHGSRCLVAWDRACQRREDGGLGVKNLEDMNHCLLMKLVHKLHVPGLLPWKTWFLSHAGLHLTGSPSSYLSALVREELPRYRSLTTVLLGDGNHTSFWHDRWILNTSLAKTFPALFSHCVSDIGSVSSVLASGLRPLFQARLTHAATEELSILSDCLTQVAPRGHSDVRLLANSQREPFSSSGAYHSLCGSTPAADVIQIWAIRLPSKTNFFAWLLFHGRLNTRAYLFHRNIRTLDESWCERCHGVLETDEHIFVGCSTAADVWGRIHVPILGDAFRRPWEIELVAPLPIAVKVDMLLLLLWHIWKARNGLIFERQVSTSQDILRRTLKDIDAWSCRYKKLRLEVQAWREWIASCIL